MAYRRILRFLAINTWNEPTKGAISRAVAAKGWRVFDDKSASKSCDAIPDGTKWKGVGGVNYVSSNFCGSFRWYYVTSALLAAVTAARCFSSDRKLHAYAGQHSAAPDRTNASCEDVYVAQLEWGFVFPHAGSEWLKT